MIFELTYRRAYPPNVRIVFKDDFEKDEERKKMEDFENYIPEPFPKHKVDEFMVSKSWFLMAVKAWFAGPIGDYERDTSGSLTQSETLVPVEGFLSHRSGPFLQYAKDLNFDFIRGDGATLASMARLQKLELVLWDFHFEQEINGKYMWQHTLEEDELKATSVAKELCAIRGLKSFTLTARPGNNGMYTNTTEKKAKFDENLKALSSVLQQSVLAPRLPTLSKTHSMPHALECAPLYRGSKVCFSCSEMHDLTLFDDSSSKIRLSDLPNTQAGLLEYVESRPREVADYLYAMQMKHGPIEIDVDH